MADPRQVEVDVQADAQLIWLDDVVRVTIQWLTPEWPW